MTESILNLIDLLKELFEEENMKIITIIDDNVSNEKKLETLLGEKKGV